MKLKTLMALTISMLPANVLRVLAYRAILGYEIHRSKIGFGTAIAVDEAKITKSRIGRFNLFIGPMSILIKEKARIENFNRFQCAYWTAQERYRDARYERRLEISEEAYIASHHFFDVAGSFVLGRNTWIAGYGSQFWTHGGGVRDRNIEIGANCYIGSAVRFAPGARIGNNVVVGLGSVVTSKFDVDSAMIGGSPARVIKEKYDWRAQEGLC